MELIKFVPKNKEAEDKEARKNELLRLIDGLRQDVEDGMVDGLFILAHNSADDTLYRTQDLKCNNDSLLGKLEVVKHVILTKDIM